MRRVFIRMMFHSILCLQLSFNCFSQSWPGIITTYAGSCSSENVTLASTTILDHPGSIALDGVGGFYVFSYYKHSIYHLTAGGRLRLAAGVAFAGYSGDGSQATSAQLIYPSGSVDSAGNLYIINGIAQRIRKVTPAGVITTVAGNGSRGYSGDGGPAVSAQLADPYSVASDSAGNLYIADNGNYRIRKVTPNGVITTMAGIGKSGYGGDGGPAVIAQIGRIFGIAIDSADNIYLADSENHRIRKVTPAGIITTVAGSGSRGYSGDGGRATSAQLGWPRSIAADSAGNVFIADSENHRIRKVTSEGVINAFAGNGIQGYSDEGGNAISAQLDTPHSLAVDSAGNLYFVDAHNTSDDISIRIRKITPEGLITTIAGGYGKGVSFFGGDGGPAASAQLRNPSGVAVDSKGNLYVADKENRRIRKVTPAGIISTIAGGGTRRPPDAHPATTARLASPQGVAVDSAGNLYYADTKANWIRKVTSMGAIKGVAGGSSKESWSSFLAGEPIDLDRDSNGPYGIAVDSADNLYVADTYQQRIRKITPNGKTATIAGNGKCCDSGNSGKATSAQLGPPFGVAVDSAGNIYMADSMKHRIRKVTPDGMITTIAGNGIGGYGGDGGPATSAQLSWPYGIAVDSSDNLYIADTQNNRIRKVTANGIITTVAGNGNEAYAGDGGPAVSAQLRWPEGIAVDSAGNLYIADTGNNCIRKVTMASK
jgi:trimeric autotransporter adhesin